MSTPVTIRPAGAGDLPQLAALIERAYRGEEARVGWTHEADLVVGARLGLGDLTGALADPSVALLVATDGRALVGCVQVTRRDAARAYLGLLTVDPGYQGRGLGRRLLRAGEGAASDFGTHRVEMTVITVRHELIAWYERRGYRRTGERRPFPVPSLVPLEFEVLERELAC